MDVKKARAEEEKEEEEGREQVAWGMEKVRVRKKSKPEGESDDLKARHNNGNE